MLLLVLTLIAVAAGVGAFAHYNPGTMNVTMYHYHFAGLPTWEVVAAAAAVPMVPYLLYALYCSVRIRMLRRRAGGRFTVGRTFDDLPAAPALEPAPAPKRSWTTPQD